MPKADIKDLNIRGVGHPKYNSDRLLEDRPMEFIIQKIENVLFSKKGDVLGDYNFGCNLEYYLWSTGAPESKIKRIITEQLQKYVPELSFLEHTIDVGLYEGTTKDILYIDIKIIDSTYNFVFS